MQLDNLLACITRSSGISSIANMHLRSMQLAAHFSQPRDAVIAALKALQEYHGVVLHPASSEIWVIHPFSAAPTNFWVQGTRGGWWSNCAWCSAGIAALVGDVTITTMLGAEATAGDGADRRRQSARCRPARTLPGPDAQRVGQRDLHLQHATAVRLRGGHR